MLTPFEVHQKVEETWPARNGKPAGHRKMLLLLDRSFPAKHRLRKIIQFAVRDEDGAGLAIFAGEPEGKVYDVAVNDIITGRTAPVLVGAIVGEHVAETASRKPAKV